MELKFILVAAAVVLVGFILFFSGRFNEDYGTIKPDQAARDTFENYQINPERVYYFSGSEVCPNAVIGVDRRFFLDSTLWEKMNPHQGNLGETIRHMQSRALESNRSLYGFVILDPRGDPLGEWYSLPGIPVVVKMLDDNRVSISTPPLTVWGDGP
jgi:hypothetical protein